MLTLIRSIGALATLMSVLGLVTIVMQLMNPPPTTTFPRGLKSPGLAIEFAQFSEVEPFLGERDNTGYSPMREYIRKGLYGDYFFIAMYWLLFVGMSALLAQRHHSWAVWAGVVAAACATGAAIFDVVENLSIAALLDAAKIQNELVRNVASAGFGKWLLVSLATIILSLVFLRRDWLALLGVLYLLIGTMGVYGLLRDSPRFIGMSFLLNFAGLLVVAVVFSVWPRCVMDKL